ncbi:MAG: hypothetical protein KTR30_14530 [Saprospiraceae bacterium]|nr:hypothetical protein [Saprospiraceae bacterium]
MQSTSFLLVLLFSLAMLPTIAQPSPPTKSLEVGYFGHYLIQPGLRIGTSIDLRTWTSAGQLSKARSLFIQPQLGYFLQPNSHQTYLGSLGLGYAIQKPKKRGWSYHAVSLGIGYQYRSTQEAFAVSLGDGSRSGKKWSNTSGWVPTMSYTQGIPIHPQLGGYYRLMFGQVFEKSGRNLIALFTEIGLRFYFN